jgi:hypothetical protein
VEHLLLGSGAASVFEELGAADGFAGDELALLRLYRSCQPEDRQILLRLGKLMSKSE